MFFSIAEDRESLKFKLLGAKDYDVLAEKGEQPDASDDNLGSWGHEFVRSLAGEIGQEYNQRVIDGADPDSDEAFEDLLKFVNIIVPFHLTHNAEAEAVDLLIEVQRLKYLLKLDSIDDKNYRRICLYLIKTASFMSDPDDLVVCNFFALELTFLAVLNCNTHFLFYHTIPIHRKCLKQRTRFTVSRNNTSMHCWWPYEWIAQTKYPFLWRSVMTL